LKKNGFSLIELLIVVVIIGVVYTLSVSTFKQIKEKKELTFLNLKDKLKSYDYKKSISIVCLDDSSKCDIYIDDKKTDSIENFIDAHVNLYKYDFSYGYVQKEFDIFFNDEDIEEDILFLYKMDKDAIGEQVLIEYKDKFYDYSSYFDGVLEYNSIEEATDAKQDMTMEVLR
jgi:prepilin-type N-terminal cleavage/methylation domain-containing protein